MNESTLYKIINGTRNPSRKNLLQIICGLGMSVEEANVLLKLAGYKELYPKYPMDMIIIYCLYNKYEFCDIEDELTKRNASYSFFSN